MSTLSARNQVPATSERLFRVSLFDRFSATLDSGQVDGVSSGKVHELFCYLLLHNGTRCSRDLLATLLWDDCTTERARKHLRQAIWRLQGALGRDTQALRVEADWVSCEVAWLDVKVFEQAFELAVRVPGEELDDVTAKRLEEAVQLYGNGLLNGVYADWCLKEHDRLEGMCVSMLKKLLDFSESRGDWSASVTYGERVLQHDPAHERTHQRLMYLHHLQGDRTSALRQFHRCVTALREELGVGVSHATQALYGLLARDELAPVSGYCAWDSRSQALKAMQTKLAQMQTMLQTLQKDLDQAILGEPASDLQIGATAKGG
jgi:DNA-binding SARP family transcriptional activator